MSLFIKLELLAALPMPLFPAKYPYPQKGDILISASESIGRTIEFSGQDEYFQDSNIVWLDHNGHIKNSFLKYFYETVNLILTSMSLLELQKQFSPTDQKTDEADYHKGNI